ncbi:Retrovirus-related Pol polyprotein from transposon TNT 1-94 [Durusdinium trenchii]|uniref:Retrovirus-related Pol polyprotein from transposon TNT 1-94 n=1 Tax=Durusdinium trenchii TaxID=1381693 RepID=A0ABP0PAH8_9DINO
MFLHRASFQGEAVLLRLLDPALQVRVRVQLSSAWAREILWRRSGEVEAEVRECLQAQLLSAPIEKLIEMSWSCYEPLMFQRRLAQVHKSGDPLRIVAVDENCQLHRRTCGMPYAEVIPCPLIGKLLLRDCSRRPYGKDTLCRQRATLRDEAPRPSHVEIGRHRLRRALRTEGDVQYLEIQMEGHGNWQPAATVHEETLRRYFATLADGNIRRRRETAAGGITGSEVDRHARAESACQTHKETEKHITAAARTAGFHMTGRKGEFCRDHCLPTSADNEQEPLPSSTPRLSSELEKDFGAYCFYHGRLGLWRCFWVNPGDGREREEVQIQQQDGSGNSLGTAELQSRNSFVVQFLTMGSKDEFLVPSWDGEVAGWPEYSQRVRLCYAQTARSKRYTLAPKLVLKLRGKAWEVAASLDYEELSRSSGTQYLMRFLQARLGRRPIPDIGQHLDEVFVRMRRSPGTDLVTWCNQVRETYKKLQRSLAKTQAEKKTVGVQTENPPDESADMLGPGHLVVAQWVMVAEQVGKLDSDDFDQLTNDQIKWVEQDVMTSMVVPSSSDEAPADAEPTWFNDGVNDWQWQDEEWHILSADGWLAYSDAKPWMDIEEALAVDPSAGKELNELYAAFEQKVRTFKEARDTLKFKGKSRGSKTKPVCYVDSAQEIFMVSSQADEKALISENGDFEPTTPVTLTQDIQRMVLAASSSTESGRRLGFAVIDTGATETAMDRFHETLDTNLPTNEAEMIAKCMVTEAQAKTKKSSMDLTKYDWTRAQFSELRDPRTTTGVCQGHHRVEPFSRGSLSGCNGHALWLTCAECRLRLLYVPRWGAKAAFRSAGPLVEDVKAKLQKDPKPDPNELKTQELVLEAAEESAMRRLKDIQTQRAKTKAKAKSGYPAAKGTETVTTEPAIPKKNPKRENDKTPEKQEKDQEEEWTRVNGE